MLNGVSTLLRVGSRIVCLIVVASFGLFVLDQAGSASAQQQNVVNAVSPQTAGKSPPPPAAHEDKKSGVRQAIDDASSRLTSPFKGVTAGVGSQWGTRGVQLVLALLVYGFGVGFLARMLRVRV